MEQYYDYDEDMYKELDDRNKRYEDQEKSEEEECNELQIEEKQIENKKGAEHEEEYEDSPQVYLIARQCNLMFNEIDMEGQYTEEEETLIISKLLQRYPGYTEEEMGTIIEGAFQTDYFKPTTFEEALSFLKNVFPIWSSEALHSMIRKEFPKAETENEIKAEAHPIRTTVTTTQLEETQQARNKIIYAE